MIQQNNNLKDFIEFFNHQELIVFPCKNKKPKISAFKEIEEQNLDELFDLFNDDDELAIRTGNKIIVIDIDVKKNENIDGFASLDVLEQKYGKLPETLTVKTRNGGQHFYFRIPDAFDQELANRQDLDNAKGVDVRGKNGYVIAPPTKDYTFIKSQSMAMLPKSWIDVINRKPSTLNGNVVNLNSVNGQGKIIDNRDEKATSIIFSSLMGLITENIIENKEIKLEQLIDDSWETYINTCDTKNPSLTLDDEGKGRDWLVTKCKYTWDRYLNDEFANEVLKIKNQYELRGDDVTQFVKVSDLLKQNLEPVSWVIEEWLVEKSICGLYASAGTGKSTIAQQLATCVSQGHNYGSKMIITKAYKTLYIACEDPANIFQSRQKNINHSIFGFNIEQAKLDNLLFMGRMGYDNRLCSFDDGSEPKLTKFYYYLDKVIKEENVKFLILDVLQDFFGGNEIIRSEVNYFMKAVLGKLIKDRDVTILYLAHPSLAGQSGHKFSGSTSWLGGLRSAWYLNKLDEENSNTLVMNRFKSNYSRSGDEENCYYKFDNGCFEPYEKDASEALQLKQFMPEVIKQIEYCNRNKIALKKIGKEYLHIIHAYVPNITKQTIDSCIKQLKNSGLITYADKKGWTAVSTLKS